MIAKFLRSFCFAFLILFSHSLFADGIGTSTGTLVGNAQDESGAILPGVLITVEGPGGARSTPSDTNGEFIFPFLTPGIYSLRAELQNFTTLEQPDFEIRSSQRIDIVLKMRSIIHEEVSVVAERQALDPTSTATVTTISHQLTEVLPLKRSLGDIIKMAPGVVDGRIGGSNLCISGATGWENTYFVDGVNITNPAFGGLGINPVTHSFMSDNGLPLTAIEETQIITAGFSPEYGESQGGVINVITKSGSNQFHGGAHFFTTPHAEQSILSDVNYELETGAEIGGPILKNKVFFYGAYELTASKTTIFLLPESPGYKVLPKFPEKSDTNAYTVKISASPWTNQALEISASGSPTHLPLSIHEGWQTDTAVNPKMAESKWDFGSNSQQMRWSGALTRSLFIEAQIGRAYNQFVLTPTSLSDNVPRIRDHTPTETEIDIGGYGGDSDSYATNWQYGVKFTNLWNHHQFRYGLQSEDISYSEENHRTGPTFTFPDGSVARNGYVIDIWHDPLIYTVTAAVPGLSTHTGTKYIYSFVQDSWDLTSRFNINLGLRWEQQTLKEEQEMRRVNFGNNWAPRIGATYDYLNNGKSKLLFHYGRFYERLPNYAAGYLSSYREAIANFADKDLTVILPSEDPTTSVPYFFGSGSVEVEGHENSKSPFTAGLAYSDEWLGGIEQEFQPGFIMRANIIFRKLERALDTVGLNPDILCQSIAPNACYPPPQTLENWLNGSDSLFMFSNVDGHIPGTTALKRNYASLQFAAEKRFSDRLQILGSYTYARLTGNYPGDDRGGTAVFADSPLAPYNHISGPLPNDIRHAVKFFGTYQLKNFITGVTFNFQTGRPITKATAFYRNDSESSIFPSEPRGASGRTEAITNIDLHAEYNFAVLGDRRFSIGADVFNVFNFQSVVAVNEVESFYYSDQLSELNLGFLYPTETQVPRSVRVLFRYSF